MIIFPAIDLLDGKVVRLKQGERGQVDVYSNKPVEIAKSFAAQGATWIHVVNLSAAFTEDDKAKTNNLCAIEEICAVDTIKIDVGGGIRSLADLTRMMDLGIARAALGTVLFSDHNMVKQALERYGSALCADLAAREGILKVNGWRTSIELSLQEAVHDAAERGFEHLVFTNVSKDGMQSGIDVSEYQQISKDFGHPVVCSGGIATLNDVRALAQLEPGVIEGAIIGRALYEKRFTLAQALQAAQSA